MIETMSLDDMREYLGQDQIPEDFDDFWKKTNNEISREY